MKPYTDLPEPMNATDGMKILGVGDLRVIRYTDENGVPHVQSHWKPSEEELKMLNEGARVSVDLWGISHAPIYVCAHRNEIPSGD